jgi:hypothetical protein
LLLVENLKVFPVKFNFKTAAFGAAFVSLVAACGGGSGSPAPVLNVPTQATGSISISITDGPWEDAQALVLHITAMELGRSNGDVIQLGMPGGPMSIDMMQLQNGVSQALVTEMEVPVGQYEWMRMIIDLNQSHLDLAGTGGRHNMQMGPDADNGLEVHTFFQIADSAHEEFMLDFDLRSGVQRHQMGMMGDQFELHSAMRLVNMAESGGVTGLVAAGMIDINHPDCDVAPGGNWAYLFPGSATEPDDISEQNTDGIPGPLAADRVEMDPGTGDHFYHFGYLPAGSYRIAFTCSGEWDEEGDDDFPSDPEGMFDFQMFSDSVDVVAGQLHRVDLMP